LYNERRLNGLIQAVQTEQLLLLLLLLLLLCSQFSYSSYVVDIKISQKNPSFGFNVGIFCCFCSGA
jgi:hypothetical protein